MDNDLKPDLAKISEVKTETQNTNTYSLELVEKQKQKKFTWTPGQFVMLSLLGIGEAALSISNTPNEGCVNTTIRTVGNVTKKLQEANIIIFHY